MPDFIPPADDTKVVWPTNLRDTLDAYSAALGLTAGRVTQIKAWCNDQQIGQPSDIVSVTFGG